MRHNTPSTHNGRWPYPGNIYGYLQRARHVVTPASKPSARVHCETWSRDRVWPTVAHSGRKSTGRQLDVGE